MEENGFSEGLGCLMTLSTIFKWYRGGQFYWWRKLEYSEKHTIMPQVTIGVVKLRQYFGHKVTFYLYSSDMWLCMHIPTGGNQLKETKREKWSNLNRKVNCVHNQKLIGSYNLPGPLLPIRSTQCSLIHCLFERPTGHYPNAHAVCLCLQGKLWHWTMQKVIVNCWGTYISMK